MAHAPDTLEKALPEISRQSTEIEDGTGAFPQEELFSGQFLDRNEQASKARVIYVKILFMKTCLIIVAVFSIFPVYWGALWAVPVLPTVFGSQEKRNS